MSCNEGGRLLAVALDAAEPGLVRKLMEQGKMPTLARLLSEGKWMRVESSARLGSGSVWPTFISGEAARVHGVYGEWLWQPETMEITRYSGGNLTPFWKGLAEKGVSVGILDLPFMPLIGLANGFEISEWGPHDLLECRTQIYPERVADLITNQVSPHPLSFVPTASGPGDYRNLQKLGDACLQGIKLRGGLAARLLSEIRPRLSLITFTEIHHAAHYLWHTAEPEHEVYRNDGLGDLSTTRPTIEEIYREVDRQIGELVKAAGEETPVIVFSLHGMRPTRGTPAFLAPLLCEMGFAQFSGWSSQSWRDRGKAVIALIKRNLPDGLKRLYYKVVPATTTHRVARTTMLPLYDWDYTQAFSLPTDQHGWIRVNLSGREARGIVPAASYEEICHQLEKRLRNLTSENGRPLVRGVIRTAERVEDALVQNIPDLVIHWEDAVFVSPLRIKGSAVQAEAVGRKYVGQHSLEGFCILKAAFESEQQIIRAEEIHLLITRLLGKSAVYEEAVCS